MTAAAMQAVLDLEAERGLWEQRVLGLPVWALERFRRYRMETYGAGAGKSAQPSGRARIEAELRSMQASTTDLRRGLPTSRGRDIWVLSSSSYRRRDGDTWTCIFADHLRQQLGDRLLFLEWNTARLESLGRDDVLFLDAVQAPILAAAKAGATLTAKRLGDLSAFAPSTPERMADRALYYRSLLELGRRWMDRAPPAAVFVLCGYNMHIPLQHAARERGIPVIELQHGVIHEGHAGYVLPTLPPAVEAGLPWPDHLVAFGRFWGESLEQESPRWAGRWSVGGHPWLKKRVGGPKEREVVIFGQYEEHVQRQVRDVAAALPVQLPGWTVTIKPHPREFDAATWYAPAIAAGARLADPQDDSYAMLARCEASVCAYSTVAIEALAFGARSIVLESPNWSEAIADLVARGKLEACADDGVAALLGAEAPGQATAELARDLFGMGEPELDFAALIADLTVR